jgi:hypothetical protein
MAATKSKAKRRTSTAIGKDDPPELRALMNQPPQLTHAQVDDLERAIQESLAPGAGGSQYRRGGLAMLAQSGERLIEIAATDLDAGEMLADFVAGVEANVQRLRSLADMLETSATRATVALCVREDAIELLREAREFHAAAPLPVLQ